MTVAATTARLISHPWARRIGVVGFWFFFIKGLLWLAAPLVVYALLQ